MVFRRDLLAAEPGDVKTIGQLLRSVAFVVETDTLDNVLEAFIEHRRHMLVVVDEFGGFAGVLTLEDVMEQILGKEIVDEFDEVDDLRGLALDRRTKAVKRTRSAEA